MVGQQAALDVAAGNIANATTPGFRADRALFRQTMVAADKRAGAVPTQSLRYAVTRTVEPDRRQGQVVQTGRPLDVALRDEESLFVIKTPQGERYTRAGSFQLQPDGRLTTSDGSLVLGAGHQPINVPPTSTSVGISPSGELVVDGEPNGTKLMVVTFARPEGLVKEGSVLLRATPAAGRATEKDPELATESLEMSNASALEGMTTLVTATREFEMLSKVVEAFSQIERRAATDIMGSR
jgi:flagellar basal body rod protein FlgG